MGNNNDFLKYISLLPLAFLFLFFIVPILALISKTTLNFNLLFDILFTNQGKFFAAFYQAFFSTLLAVLMGLPLAWIIANFKFPFKKIVHSLLLIPFVMPSVLMVLSFILLFGVNGLFSQILLLFGGENLRFLYSPIGIILAHGFYNFPIISRLVSSSWQSQDKKQENAARSLGATALNAFLLITLPRLMPAILAGAALVFIYSFMSFAIVLTFGGVEFAGVEVGIYSALSFNLDLNTAAGLALLQFVFLSIIVFIYYKLGGIQQHENLTSRNYSKIKLFTKKGAIATGIIIASILAVLSPILSLLWFTVFDFKTHSIRSTLAPLVNIFFPEGNVLYATTPLTAIFYSISFALLAALIATTISIFWVLKKKKEIASIIFVSSLALSPMALATGYIIFYGSGSWILIVFAHSLLALPFTIRAIELSYKRISSSIWNVAATLGASKEKQLLKIGVPLMKDSIIAGFAFAFAISLSELGLALTLGNGQWVTLPVYILRFLSSFNIVGAIAVGLVMLIVGVIVFYVIERFSKNTGVI